MSHCHLLSHIPDPLRHFDNNTPVGMTQSPHPLVCHRLLFKQPPRPSASVLVSMSHKTRWCLELCSPPHASPAPPFFWPGTESSLGRPSQLPGLSGRDSAFKMLAQHVAQEPDGVRTWSESKPPPWLQCSV